MGQREKYAHEIIGYQDRLDELQGALLAIKLRHLDRWNTERREQAAWYAELLANAPVETPVEAPGREHVYHLYVVRAPQRDELKDFLAERGIGSGIFYPIPVHLQGAYADHGYTPGAFPQTERAVAETLALPVFPGYTRSQIEYVAESVAAFYETSAKGVPRPAAEVA